MRVTIRQIRVSSHPLEIEVGRAREAIRYLDKTGFPDYVMERLRTRNIIYADVQETLRFGGDITVCLERDLVHSGE